MLSHHIFCVLYYFFTISCRLIDQTMNQLRAPQIGWKLPVIRVKIPQCCQLFVRTHLTLCRTIFSKTCYFFAFLTSDYSCLLKNQEVEELKKAKLSIYSYKAAKSCLNKPTRKVIVFSLNFLI